MIEWENGQKTGTHFYKRDYTDIKKAHEIMPNIISIMEMQINILMRYY